uniref:7TM_GPCR_Srx domain-containing protein n=1 Tax=Steinernema glaseri TaxID=37863 RepID=A0A1I7YK89_9BILA
MPVLLFATITMDLVALVTLYRLPAVRRSVSSSATYDSNRKSEMRLCYMILVECICASVTFLFIRVGFLVDKEFLQFMMTTFMWSAYSSVDA